MAKKPEATKRPLKKSDKPLSAADLDKVVGGMPKGPGKPGVDYVDTVKNADDS